MGSREDVINACEDLREIVANCDALDKEIDALNDELTVIAGLVNQCVKENATSIISQDEYTIKYNGLVKRYEKASEALRKATEEKSNREDRDRELRIFIASLKERPLVVEEWNEELWITLLDTATVHNDRTITFAFKNGTTIDINV